MNQSRIALLLPLALFASYSFAHDEGHGPKLSDQPKQGGIVMPVIDKKEANLGSSAKMIYKAELVRKENGEAVIVVYDDKMNALPDSKLAATAVGKIGPMKKNPKWKSEEIKFAKSGAQWVGKLPQIKVKPYYIDVTLQEGDRTLLTAFENLD